MRTYKININCLFFNNFFVTIVSEIDINKKKTNMPNKNKSMSLKNKGLNIVQ